MGVGFEPTVTRATTVFKTAAFDLSAIPPKKRPYCNKKKRCCQEPIEHLGGKIKSLRVVGVYQAYTDCKPCDFLASIWRCGYNIGNVTQPNQKVVNVVQNE